MPLPVFTLAAWTSMSKAAVVTSGLFIVRVAFHWSNLPTIETEDFTLNVTELETGVTSNTGTCARLSGVNTAVATRERMVFRIRKSGWSGPHCQLLKVTGIRACRGCP